MQADGFDFEQLVGLLDYSMFIVTAAAGSDRARCGRLRGASFRFHLLIHRVSKNAPDRNEPGGTAGLGSSVRPALTMLDRSC
jgi:hypothetical protein